ncbi:hypothetical protein [Parachlamydia acanthamoebae]|uniref:hypothetical protein n=1 Tax=Parachlamydia acanthamoebae TaxID=83552 RepID=UPI000750AE9E|nr:hypothetical protein [Parachlamydia acanthamoebae]
MPYIFVLVPPTDLSLKYVNESQRLFDDCNKDYRLTSDGTSSPHISIVQFDCESAEIAHTVWINMQRRLREENFQPFSPPFSGVAFVNGTGPYQETVWAELSVDRGEENSPIMCVHSIAVEVVQAFGLKLLNACGNRFRPHLTLARITMPKEIKAWSEDLCLNPGNFNLKFGESDEKF